MTVIEKKDYVLFVYMNIFFASAVFVGKDYDDSWCTVPYFVSI